MNNSFLDQERNDAENISFHTAGDTSLQNVTLNDTHETVIEVRGEDSLPDNLLLAAGDGNRNPAAKLKTPEKTTQDFIKNEISPPDELNTSGKRKREQSPDGRDNGMDVSEGSGEESENEDDGTDNGVDVTPPPTHPKKKGDTPEKVATRTNIDDNLPDTVTLLTAPTAKVYLIGTAHFSIESQEDVAKIIRAVQPHVVLVELCKARINILQLDEETILEEAKNINFAKIRSTIKHSGLFQGLMYLLLLSMSAHLTKELGMAPGGEFRRAVAEANQFSQCIIHLGDRPIHITLQRALSSLSWWQTIRLTWHLLTSKGPITKEEVERCKQRDLLEEMLAEMTGEFPDLSTVFVKERDIYLTHSLQVAAGLTNLTSGSEPVKVVGVVGIGHVPGILQHWGKVTQEDIHPLLFVPPPTLTSRIIRVGAKVTVVGLVVWGCTRVLPVQKVLPSLGNLKTSLTRVFQ